jgi:hypothetical protein
MTPSQRLSALQEELLSLKDRNALSTEGERALKLLQSGVATQGVGSFLQGLTLNFSDEAIGAIRSYLSPEPAEIAKNVQRYEQAQSQITGAPTMPPLTPAEAGAAVERVGLQQYGEQFPVRAMTAEIGGAMIPGVLAPASTIPRMIGTAAVTGGIAGAGQAEGGLEQRGVGAMIGAPIGAAAGAAGGVVQRVGGKAYKSMVDAMFKPPERAGVESARQVLKEAIESDVGDINQALAMVLQRSGKPYSLADVGPNTRAYLDAAATIPGPGKQVAEKFLRERDKGMLSRITSDIQEAFGSRAGFFDEFNALKDARSELGSKLYDRAFRVEIPVNTELTNVLRTPAAQNAYDRAARIAADRNIPLPEVKITPEGRLVTNKGDEVKGINTEFLHFIKMGLDDVIFTGKAPTSGIGKTELSGQKDVRQRLLNMIDRNNPSYKRARNYWADETAAMDAMQEGRNFLRADYDELASDLRKMSMSEKEAFRLGAMQNLLDKIGGAQVGETVFGGTMTDAKKLLTPNAVRMMRLTFPEGDAGQQSFDKFIGNLTDELQMKATSQSVLGGSQTAGRLQASQKIKDEAAREIPGSLTMTGMLMQAMRRDMGAMSDAQMRSTASELSRILTATDPNALQRIARELENETLPQILRRRLPEVPAAFGRGLIGPYQAGQLGGSFGGTFGQQLPAGLLME